ncbi:lysophosphatidic acid receptor 1-A-like [Physella acuta]|uniref:lysophosphatidic acid receptor 1-A-like n=1 Tax=Physella acuta TaxID=109671 RepID=UPI0027DC0733|nr:lysophosphatidic acid receptor 1-A-like [Physella acuta]
MMPYVPVISVDIAMLFMTVNVEYLNCLVSASGVLANALNIAVFWRLGFKDNVNISLFVLAVAEFFSVMTAMVFSLTSNPDFVALTLIEPIGFQSLVASFPRATLSRIISCVIAFVTFEKCMCVLIPLKVKRIITRRVTALVLSSLFISLSLTLIPFYLQLYLNWKFIPTLNQTWLCSFLTGSTPDTNITLSIHAFVQVFSYILIIIFTSILSFEIRKRSKWLKMTTLGDQGNHKGTRTILMVSCVAGIYIVCYLPSLVLLLTGLAEPKFAIFREERNIYLLFYSFNILLETFNSSINMLVYYNMSGKYRAILIQMLRCRSRH